MEREDRENMEARFLILWVGHRQVKRFSRLQVCFILVLDIRPEKQKNIPNSDFQSNSKSKRKRT